MVRRIDEQIGRILDDVNDNIKRIDDLRPDVDYRMDDKKQVDQRKLGEMVQREEFTANALKEVANVIRKEHPEQALGYEQRALGYHTDVAKKMIRIGDIRQARQSLENAIDIAEDIEEEMGNIQRREPSKRNYDGNKENYGGRFRSGRTDERQTASEGNRRRYHSAVSAVVVGIIIMILTGVPGLTGAVIGVKQIGIMSVIGATLILIGVGLLIFRRKEIK
jgi:hypothetical protein